MTKSTDRNKYDFSRNWKPNKRHYISFGVSMSIEAINQIKEEVENIFCVNLKKLRKKKIIYDGVTQDNKSLILISPSSKLHSRGCGWVDITKIQKDLASGYSLAVTAFRLPDRKTYYVDFDKLSEHLSKKAMMNNSHEGDHWKLYIWSEYIEIRNSKNKLPIRHNALLELAAILK